MKKGPAVELDPDALAMLDPDMIRLLTGIVNSRLREQESLWAATDKEEADFVVVFNKLLDKWFPEDVSSWSPEILFLSFGLLYAGPRVFQLVTDRRKAAASLAEQEAEPVGPVADPGNMGPDDPRLKDLGGVPS